MIENTINASLRVASMLVIGGLLASCSSQLKYDPRDQNTVSPVKVVKKPVVQPGPCGFEYTVVSGDTLSEIARDCNVDMKAIAALNDLLPPYIIYIKQSLKLPSVSDDLVVKHAIKPTRSNARSLDEAPPKEKPKPVKTVGEKEQKVVSNVASNVSKPVQKKVVKPLPKPVVKSVALPKKKLTPTRSVTAKAIERKILKPNNKTSSRWVWPTHKKLGYDYRRDKAGLSVLEVYGVIGHKVTSVAAGKIVYAGNGIANYGLMLVVKHEHEYMSIYAHNSKLLVAEGDYVDAGQEIALMGSTGKTDIPKLYLEARYQGRKIDIKKKLKP